jgi:hypothetical protein
MTRAISCSCSKTAHLICDRLINFEIKIDSEAYACMKKSNNSTSNKIGHIMNIGWPNVEVDCANPGSLGR